MNEPRRLSEGMSDELRATLLSVGDRKVRPTAPNGRMRYCTRCERIAHEFERHDPSWLPPLAHSWVSNGLVYWTDRCMPCLEFEKRQRASVATVAHNPDGGPKATLGMRSAASWKPREGHWSER